MNEEPPATCEAGRAARPVSRDHSTMPGPAPHAKASAGDIVCAVAGLIAQVGIGCGIYVAHALFHRHWDEIIAGVELPQITTLSFAWMRAVPWITVGLIVLGLILPVLRRRIVRWTLLVILIEALVMAILMMGLCYPATAITYRLG